MTRLGGAEITLLRQSILAARARLYATSSMPKTTVIIPARWASTRFPGKPLFTLLGKPLVQHVWERSIRAKGIDSVVIATDDMRIAEAAFGFGAEVAMTSPKCVSGTDRCAEVAARLKNTRQIINVQGDEPMVDPLLISKIAMTLRDDPTLPMVTAAVPFAEGESTSNPNAVKVVLNRFGNALYFSRNAIPFLRDTDNFPYLRHIGIYGYSTKFLLQFVRWPKGKLEGAESLEQLRALENGAIIRVLKARKASLGVDTPEDARVAEKLMRGVQPSASRRSKKEDL
jgi:3-deoxy-manno-octulosonate cytidylyltransferase (CMP-KDO synthetase)